MGNSIVFPSEHHNHNVCKQENQVKAMPGEQHRQAHANPEHQQGKGRWEKTEKKYTQQYVISEKAVFLARDYYMYSVGGCEGSEILGVCLN